MRDDRQEGRQKGRISLSHNSDGESLILRDEGLGKGWTVLARGKGTGQLPGVGEWIQKHGAPE